jgi:hypothetical protein
MKNGTIYIFSALIFGLAVPFLKLHFHEWWQVGLIALVYVGGVRLLLALRSKR